MSTKAKEYPALANKQFMLVLCDVSFFLKSLLLSFSN